MKSLLFTALCFSVLDCFGQIQTPQTPTFPAMQPVHQTVATQPQVQLPPSYHPSTQERQKQQNQQLMMQQAASQKQKELQELMRDIQELQARSPATNSHPRFTPNPERTKGFPYALQHLQDMLTGKLPLSVADAYFTIENAFGNCYVTKQQYNQIINESADFIKTWMQQNGLDAKDNYQVHYAIKRFMSETLTITKRTGKADKGTDVQTISHASFHYDYNDYSGEQDYRNLFITKCLATGFGQCASMPGVYLILAEKLGVKAYLSFAPQHSFIKHPDNSGNIVNYEPTSNWEISDKWYKDNLFISAEAVRSGIFLDTLNSRQVVANCVFDLAVQYIKVDLTGNEAFILNCLKVGTPYFPKNNNLTSLFIYSMHLKTVLREIMRKHNLKTLEDLERLPEAQPYYQEYIGNEKYIASLGYQDMPAGMYEAMLQHQEFKGKVQANLNVSGKEKRNLFVKTEQ